MTVRRFMINDTVDTQLLLKMQERKDAEIEKAIDNKKESDLSVPELMRLFGPIKADQETGRPLIDSDSTSYEEFILVQDERDENIPPRPF